MAEVEDETGRDGTRTRRDEMRKRCGRDDEMRKRCGRDDDVDEMMMWTR
jgi:hypothetical protein